MALRKPLLVFCLSLAALLAACETEQPTPPQQGFSFQLATTTLSIEQGQSQNLSLVVTRQGGFADAIALSLENAPAGVQGNGLVTQNGTTGAIALRVDASAAPVSNAEVMVVATAGDKVVKQAFALSITAAPPSEAFSWSMTPSVLTVAAGFVEAVDVTLVRNAGFDGEVTFSVENAPEGVTVQGFVEAGETQGGFAVVARPDMAATGPVDVTVVATSGNEIQRKTLSLTVVRSNTPSEFFSWMLTPNTLSVVPGETKSVEVTVTRAAGFNDEITLFFDVEPQGLSALGSVAAGQSVGSLQVVAANNAPEGGPHVVTVIAASESQVQAKLLSVSIVANPAAEPKFDWTLDPEALTLEQGQSADATIMLSRNGGFNGAVSFSLENAPAGISGNTTVEAGQGLGELVIAASDNAPVGTHTLTLVGTGGNETRRKSVSVTVTQKSAPQEPFTLSLDPDTLTIKAGETKSVTVNVVRAQGFNQQIGLSLANAPQGISAQGVVEAGQSTGSLTVTAATDSPSAGPLSLQVVAQSQSETRSTSLTLTVVAATPNEPATTHFFLLDESDIRNTTNPRLEIDANGGVHMVYPAYAIGDAFYTYCPEACNDIDAASIVKFPTNGTVGNAMLALDANNKPHVLLSTFQNVYYASCTGDCRQDSAWRIDLVLSHQGEFEVSGEAFALDPQGRPRFVMHPFRSLSPIGNPSPGAYFVTCDANCQDAANWTRSQIATQLWQETSLRYSPSGRAHIGTAVYVEGFGDVIAYFYCDSLCGSEANWNGAGLRKAFSNPFVSGIYPIASLELTQNGLPRMAALGDDGSGGPLLMYFSCDQGCTTAENWTLQGLIDNELEAGLDLALDHNDRPRIAYNADHNIVMVRCDGDCRQESAWRLEPIELGSNIPTDDTVPYFNCSVSAWFLQNPSIGIGADGHVRVAYRAIDVSGPFDPVDPNHPRCTTGADMTLTRFAQLTN